MDPLSITASVIAVIELADRIIFLCQGYVAKMKDAPSDLRAIMVKVNSLKSMVTSLEYFLSTWGTGNMLHIVKSLEGPEGPLEASRQSLMALETLFPSAIDYKVIGAKRRATSISYAKLAWPFKQEKARKILKDIDCYQASISLALTTDTANDTKNIKAIVERLCDALDLETRENILNWLVETDPSPNHNTACALHDSHTGTWITKADKYQEWKNGSSRFFWFHGIPGAGKTVLFSYIVEDVKNYCKTSGNKDITCSYYYCYFGRAQDEAPHFLRWVINQLCRESQYIPTEILDSFRSGEQTSVPVLIQALSAVLRNFRYVYVMLDALDETLERRNLLRLLNQLAGDSFEKLRLLVSSRKEIDIERSLTPISTSMSLSNPYVDEDIRIYIQNQLQDHHKLCTWPKPLSDEISAALVKGAKGMFRWAACHIDILGRLNNVSDIRKALHELPETLDQTYERILMEIPQGFSKIAHRTLQLLAFHGDKSISKLNCLAEAVVVDVEQLSFSPDKRLLDKNDLFEICTCLITLNSKDEVTLAHYTVKEFLVSERIQRGPATSFQISEIACDVLTSKIFLIYLLNITYESIGSFEDYLHLTKDQRQDYHLYEDENFPLLSRAVFWDGYTKTLQGPDTACLDDLLIRLFDPKRLNYKNWLELNHIHSYNITGDHHSPLRWKTQPGAEAAIAFANACFYDLERTAKVMLVSNPNLSTSGELLEIDKKYNYDTLRTGMRLDLLDVAINFSRDRFVKLLLDSGANPDGNSRDGFCKLLFALNCLHDSHLLEAGADPNPRGVALTALQAAAICDCSAIVKLLLNAGAHVNAVGNDEAIIVGVERGCITEDTPFTSEVDIDDIAEDRYSQLKIQQVLYVRGRFRNYETPLRIVENRLRHADGEKRDELLAMENVLKEKGGKSLNLFPEDKLWDWILADDLSPSHVSFGVSRSEDILGSLSSSTQYGE